MSRPYGIEEVERLLREDYRRNAERIWQAQYRALQDATRALLLSGINDEWRPR